MNYQWFDGFSTDDPIKCPYCDVKIEDCDWSYLTDYLVKNGILGRKIVHKTWLSAGEYLKLKDRVELGREYDHLEIDTLRRRIYGYDYNTPFSQSSITDIVYFTKTNDVRTRYVFEYGDYLIRDLIPKIQKEIAEIVFHPKNIKNIEDLDSM